MASITVIQEMALNADTDLYRSTTDMKVIKHFIILMVPSF